MQGADGTIASGALPVAAALAVLAGLVSFASPCVLPLVPGFLGYVSGLSEVALADRRRSRMVLGAALFVAGFSVVFLVGTLAVSAAGAALREHQNLLTRIGGAVVVLLALVYLGVGASAGTQREVRTHWRPVAGLAGAPLLGAAFAVGWTPCTGPTLAAIYAIAAPLAGDAPVARGAVLAAAYSLGLGLPFVLIAAGWARAARASAWLRRHQRAVQLVGGGLLLLLGLLMLGGVWQGIMTWLQSRLISGFETVL
ncbi:MAG: cytochrome c biogenesis protein CcdA [Actinomycetales bacterium]|nr:cytochrome c biogenesis protein CcdA [Actinomycetales bacterium]